MDNDSLWEKSSGDSFQVKASWLGFLHYNKSNQHPLMNPHQSSCPCRAPFSLLSYKYNPWCHCLRLTMTLRSQNATLNGRDPQQWSRIVSETLQNTEIEVKQGEAHQLSLQSSHKVIQFISGKISGILNQKCEFKVTYLCNKHWQKQFHLLSISTGLFCRISGELYITNVIS